MKQATRWSQQRLGWQVQCLVVGIGPVAWRGRIAKTDLELRAYPIGGFVIPLPPRAGASRLSEAAIYAAGPGAELLVAGAAVVFVGPANLLQRSELPGILLAQALCIAVAISAISNLLPHSNGEPGDTRMQSDGLGILRSLFAPRES